MPASIQDLIDCLRSLDGDHGVIIRSVTISCLSAEVYTDGTIVLSGVPDSIADQTLGTVVRSQIECDCTIDDIERMISEKKLPPDERWYWNDERRKS